MNDSIRFFFFLRLVLVYDTVLTSSNAILDGPAGLWNYAVQPKVVHGVDHVQEGDVFVDVVVSVEPHVWSLPRLESRSWNRAKADQRICPNLWMQHDTFDLESINKTRRVHSTVIEKKRP